LKIGELPGLGLSRVFLAILLFFVGLQILNNRSFRKRLSFYKLEVNTVAILFSWMVTASLISSEAVLVSIYQSIDWFVTGPLVMIIAFVLVKNKADIQQILIAIFYSLMICNVLGLLELIIQRSLFADMLISVTEYTSKASSDKFREGQYRIKSVFANPLVYAQFLLVSVTTSIYFFRYKMSGLLRFLAAVNILISYVLLYYTGSRAGLYLGAVYPAVLLYITLLQQRDPVCNAIIKLINFIAIPALIILLTYFIGSSFDLAENLSLLYRDGTFAQQSISTLARVLQIKYGIAAISESPLLGYGMGQSLVNMYPLRSIDNLYLSMLLETGIIGFLIQCFFMLVVLRCAIFTVRAYRRELDEYYMITVILLLAMYLILSIDHANFVLFLYFSLILSSAKTETVQRRKSKRRG